MIPLLKGLSRIILVLMKKLNYPIIAGFIDRKTIYNEFQPEQL
jgi:hypothetical protein